MGSLGSSVDDAIAKTMAKPTGATQHAAPPPPEGFRVLTEHSAHLLFPVDNEVFYNNAQIFNRDLSVLVARLFLQQQRAERAEKLATRVQKWEAAKADPAKVINTEHPDPEGKGPSGARVLDALSASGMRAIRYAKELDQLSLVMANDYQAEAVESIKRNVTFNGLPSGLVEARHADAALTMMLHREPAALRFDVVDLDPFGSPTSFLDSAVQAVSEGGMLAVTCTDMAVLCGNHPEACFGKYGAMPLRGGHCHEFALRLVLGCLQTHAARYKRYVVPYLSCSIDFYVRLFVRVYTSPQNVKYGASKLSHAYQCVDCESVELNPLGHVVQRGNATKFTPPTFCARVAPAAPEPAVEAPAGQAAEPAAGGRKGGKRGGEAWVEGGGKSRPKPSGFCMHCGGRLQVGGPVWNGPIHDAAFVKGTLGHLRREGAARYTSVKKLTGLITAMSEEIPDAPMFQTLHGMSKVLGCTSPSMQLVRSALINAGYKVSQSHTNPLAVKTDAPNALLWDIMRCFVRDHPVKAGGRPSPGMRILAKEPEHQADFAYARGSALPDIPRFLPNPEDNWGPKAIPGKGGKRKARGGSRALAADGKRAK